MNGDTLERIDALLMLYLNQGSANDALSLLDRSKEIFERENAQDGWLFWKVQALTSAGNYQEALEAARTSTDTNHKRILESIALRALGKSSGDPQAFIDHLENWYTESGDGKALLELCEELAVTRNWDKLADHSNQLMADIGTEDALRLAIQGNFHANRIDTCLELITKHTDVYPDRTLPNDLHRLKVACQTKLGQLSKALIDAEELVRRKPDIVNIKTLMDVQLAKGDLKGLAITARLVLNQEGISAKDLLRTARLVLHEDSETASKAWHKAMDLGLEGPNEVASALDLGFRLGLDHELEPLSRKVRELTAKGEGPFRAVAFSELREWHEAQSKTQASFNEAYNKGGIPIHILAERLRVAASYIFHGLCEQNRRTEDPLEQPVIFARHGGRPLQRQFVAGHPSWALHLDITSLLLAADLGILDLIEEKFRPIRISRLLPTALVQQLDNLKPHQPAVLTQYKTLSALLGASRIGRATPAEEVPSDLAHLVQRMGEHWVKLVASFAINNGALVEFTPLTSHDGSFLAVDLPDALTGKIVNCRSVLESLRAAGHLSDAVYRKALNDLGAEGLKEASGTLPKVGRDLLLVGNTSAVLTSINVIETVCQHFNVYIDDEFIDTIQAAIKNDEDRESLVRWIDRVLKRLNSGIDQGTYLPVEITRKEDDRDIENYTVLAFYEFFQFNTKPGDVLCIDDRFSNGFSNRDGVPIISLLEVIEALRVSQTISEERYFQIILSLRSANVRYVPVMRDEILFHLQQAQVVDAAIIESPELRCIRKYIAACLLDEGRLQSPPMPAGSSNLQGEIAFIASTLREITDAILHGWEVPDNGNAFMRADWILNNLFTGLFGTRHLRHEMDANSDGLDLIGLDIGGAFARGIGLKSKQRRNYFQWLETRLLRPRVKTDPSASAAISDALRKLISGLVSRERPSEEESLAQRVILQRLYFDLPTTIQDELKVDPELMATLGVEATESIVLNDQLVFPAKAFWRAIEQALHGDTVETLSLANKETFVFQNTIDQSAIAIRNKNTSSEVLFADPVIGLLHGDAADWKSLLYSHRKWFDTDIESVDKTVTEIIALTDARLRIEKVSHARQHSAAVFYTNLEKELVDSGEFNFEKLSPVSFDSLIRYYRLHQSNTDSLSFREALEVSADLLLDEGLDTAIYRLMCFPTPLPHAINIKWMELGNEERKHLIETIAPRCTSPLRLMHLLSLLLRFESDSPWRDELINRTTTALFDTPEGQDDFNLFLAILNWVNDDLYYRPDVKLIKPSVRLGIVWAHATTLHTAFQTAHAEPNATAKIFESYMGPVTSEIFDRDINYWNDVMHPRRANRTVLLTHGLARALEDVPLEAVSATSIASNIVRVMGIGEMDLPQNPILLRDSSLAKDGLGSILGGDRWSILSKFLSSAQQEKLNSSTLKASVSEALERLLANPDDSGSWLTLTAILGELPIYEDLREKAEQLIGEINLLSFSTARNLTASLALQFISGQVFYKTDSALKSRLIKQLIELGKTKTTQQREDDDELDEFDATLFTSILNMSLIPGDPKQSSKDFYSRLRPLWSAVPSCMRQIRSGLIRIAFGLPVGHLQGAWPLILYSRARTG
jgi:hypothetical protein